MGEELRKELETIKLENTTIMSNQIMIMYALLAMSEENPLKNMMHENIVATMLQIKADTEYLRKKQKKEQDGEHPKYDSVTLSDLVSRCFEDS